MYRLTHRVSFESLQRGPTARWYIAPMQEHSSVFASVEHASLIETDLAATRPLARLGVVTKHRRLASLASSSPKMRQITDLLERIARTDVTLTLVGETGAGKDVL